MLCKIKDSPKRIVHQTENTYKSDPRHTQIWPKMIKISDFWNLNCVYLAEDDRYLKISHEKILIYFDKIFKQTHNFYFNLKVDTKCTKWSLLSQTICLCSMRYTCNLQFFPNLIFVCRFKASSCLFSICKSFKSWTKSNFVVQKKNIFDQKPKVAKIWDFENETIKIHKNIIFSTYSDPS